jgi:hypothetical protein
MAIFPGSAMLNDLSIAFDAETPAIAAPALRGLRLLLLVIGVTTVIIGIVATASASPALMRLGFGRYSILEGLFDVALAHFTRRHARTALFAAAALQLLDLTLMLYIAPTFDGGIAVLAGARIVISALLVRGWLYARAWADTRGPDDPAFRLNAVLLSPDNLVPHWLSGLAEPEVAAPNQAAQPALKTCPKCGSRQKDGLEYGPECGTCGVDIAKFLQARARVEALEATLGRSWSRPRP